MLGSNEWGCLSCGMCHCTHKLVSQLIFFVSKFVFFSRSFFRKIKMLAWTMNTVYRGLLHRKSQIHTRGHLRNSKRAQCHVVAVINRVMSHARVNERYRMSIQSFVMFHRNQLRHKSVDPWTVHRNGLKANGESARHRAVKMEQESVKFIVKLSKLMGEHSCYDCMKEEKLLIEFFLNSFSPHQCGECRWRWCVSRTCW